MPNRGGLPMSVANSILRAQGSTWHGSSEKTLDVCIIIFLLLSQYWRLNVHVGFKSLVSTSHSMASILRASLQQTRAQYARQHTRCMSHLMTDDIAKLSGSEYVCERGSTENVRPKLCRSMQMHGSKCIRSRRLAASCGDRDYTAEGCSFVLNEPLMQSRRSPCNTS